MTEIIRSSRPEIEDQADERKLAYVRKADAAVKSMSDFTSPSDLYQELIRSVRTYHPSADISMIEKAYAAAFEAHKDQKRKSGEPYIIHPLCVAIILADLELDKETLVAGLLHDAVEDTWMTSQEVEKEFGILPLSVIPEGEIEGLTDPEEKKRKHRRHSGERRKA